jgi:hypothetical protein
MPLDFLWWPNSVYLTQVFVALEDRARVESLLAVMAPFAGRNAIMSNAISFGSASLHIARLQSLLGNHDAAQALEFNTRTRQQVWATRTRLHYAEMLMARGHAADDRRIGELLRVAAADAYEMGMAGVEASAECYMNSRSG